ncbi:hypothetical protein AGMMS50249_5070 [candidate division SR1 bacterium]|nr:hypothetical protein AGMMS50249_5070 [candidate division SR1 bacterium]
MINKKNRFFMKNKIKTAEWRSPANIITYCRFPIILYGGILIYEGDIGIGYLLCLIGILTDILDGKVARKYHCETELGKILDPIADKFLFIVMGFSLWYQRLIPEFLCYALIIHLTFLSVGWIYIKKTGKKAESKSNMFGKITMWAVCISFLLHFLFHYILPLILSCINIILSNDFHFTITIPQPWIVFSELIGYYFHWLTSILLIASPIQYAFRSFQKHKKQSLQ